MVVFARASREYDFVPGKGGCLRVLQYDANGRVAGAELSGLFFENADFFDVSQYVIRRDYTNENTSHSGDNGGESWTRVGQAWSFAANVSFSIAAVFVEQLIGSSRGVAIQFNIGDPEYWTNRGERTRSYRGKALARFTESTNKAQGIETVKLNVEGVGQGLLLNYFGEDLAYPFAETV